MVFIQGRPATYTTPGVKDYYRCNRCNIYYADELGQEPISNFEEWKVIPKIEITVNITKNPELSKKGKVEITIGDKTYKRAMPELMSERYTIFGNQKAAKSGIGSYYIDKNTFVGDPEIDAEALGIIADRQILVADNTYVPSNGTRMFIDNTCEANGLTGFIGYIQTGHIVKGTKINVGYKSKFTTHEVVKIENSRGKEIDVAHVSDGDITVYLDMIATIDEEKDSNGYDVSRLVLYNNLEFVANVKGMLSLPDPVGFGIKAGEEVQVYFYEQNYKYKIVLGKFDLGIGTSFNSQIPKEVRLDLTSIKMPMGEGDVFKIVGDNAEIGIFEYIGVANYELF